VTLIFSKDSDVSLVVTSCGRFDLLKRTLASFDTFNTLPIREVFITEDSGNEKVRQCIPEHWQEYSTFFINVPRLGQLRSIDLAYSYVKTPWIFHCEDDWAFYRPGFIEDSKLLLEADHQALQVWLRSFAHDLSVHSPYLFLGERKILCGVPFYYVQSNKEDWQGFSLNPGLRRLSDYLSHSPYSGYTSEKELSRMYAREQRHALILENDAVLHTGFDAHVYIPKERVRKKRRKNQDRIRLGATFVMGVLLGIFL
jgi:hypothetical protein